MNRKVLKLNGTVSLTEARFAAAAGFDFVGFCFDKGNENYISPTKAKEIMDWISGPEPVAEFGTMNDLEETEQIISLLGFEYIQSSNMQILNAYTHSDVKIISSVAGISAPNIVYYLAANESDITAQNEEKTIVTIDRARKDIKELLNIKAAGFSFDSVAEDKPGMGDVADLSDILEELND